MVDQVAATVGEGWQAGKLPVEQVNMTWSIAIAFDASSSGMGSSLKPSLLLPSPNSTANS